MKFERTDSFDRDYKRLSNEEKKMFRDAVREFNTACDLLSGPAGPWPGKLRVKAMVNAPSIFEMTWSFTGPDGRATWEWVQIEGERAVRWRRIGGHEIFKEP